jgi:hypothetical protein
MKKKFLFGIKKEYDAIYFITYEDDRNYVSLTHDAYDGRSIISEDDGEKQAKERLSDEEYWNDTGMLPSGKSRNFLIDFIDFDKVAEHVINNDGWENVNGEYKMIGTHNDVDYFVTFESCGALSSQDLSSKEFKYFAQSKGFIMALMKELEIHNKDISKLTEHELIIHEQFIKALEGVPASNLEDCDFLIPYLLSEEGFNENKFYNTLRSNKRQ